MSSRACSRCGVEVPVENITLHTLRCCGQPQQPVVCASSSQSHEDSTAASAAPSTSEVHTEADEPSEQGAPDSTEVRSGFFLEDVELEEQRQGPSSSLASSDDNASATQGTWQCPRCTFSNSMSNDVCEMCMAGSPAHQETDDEDVMVNRPNLMARSALVGQGKDIVLMLVLAFSGCLIGSVWGVCFGDGKHIMDSAFYGMAMGTLFGCACGQVICRCRQNQQQRDLPDLPLVDPLSARSRPLLSSEDISALGPSRLRQSISTDASLASIDALGSRAPRFAFGRRARGRSEEEMVNTLLRQNQMLEEMLERVGNMVPQMEPANAQVVSALPTHKVSAEEVQLAPPEHKACTICIEDFCEGDEQRTLPCFHRFHKDCVDQWLERNGACPICKHRVDEGQA